MQRFQDKETGIEWHFEDDVADVFQFRDTPKTLTTTIKPRPSDAHVWIGGAWVLPIVL